MKLSRVLAAALLLGLVVMSGSDLRAQDGGEHGVYVRLADAVPGDPKRQVWGAWRE